MPVEKEKAAVLAKNEQLRANLLRAISHDLRTPLTSISGNASNLLSNGETFDTDTKKQLYNDIYDDSMWLIGLVENLLAVTRIEEGRLNLNISQNLIDDAITEASIQLGVASDQMEYDVIEKEVQASSESEAVRQLSVPVSKKLVTEEIKAEEIKPEEIKKNSRRISEKTARNSLDTKNVKSTKNTKNTKKIRKRTSKKSLRKNL